MSLPVRLNRKLTHCTNCEENLPDGENFCPACGQKNLDRKVPFWTFAGDFIRDEFKLDNRFFRTIRYLVARPGFLTVEFMEGKRRSYVRPAQLFLLLGFICAFIVSIQLEEKVGALDKENFTIIGTEGITFLKNDPAGDNAIEKYIRSHIKEANDNPKVFIKNTLQKLPFVLLIVLPIFALFQKLIYFRHNIYFVEHLVFLLHAHSFLFILIFIGALVFILFGSGVLPFISLGMLVYLILSFRVVYGQGMRKTLLKFFLLFWIYFILVPSLWIFFGIFAGLIS